MATKAKAKPKLKTKTESKPRPQPPLPSRGDLPPAFDQLIGLDEIAAGWGISKRKAEQMRAIGEIPPPDTMAGTLPRWRVSTINAIGRKDG